MFSHISSNKGRCYEVWHGKDRITILLQFSSQSQEAEFDYLVIGISRAVGGWGGGGVHFLNPCV